MSLLIVCALLTATGVGVWIYQITQGLAITGMNNGSSWGLYIACFMFFVGLSAGGLIVASSASVFGVRDFKKVSRPAVLLSTVCIIAAAAFILIDLGGIQRVFNLIIHPNLTSPLMWDVIVISVYLLINLVYLVLLRKPDEQRSARALAITSRFALPVAILVHSVTAWIFGLEIAKAGWYSAIMAPLFVSSALDSGLALLLVVLVVLNAARLFETSRKLIASLAGLLAVFIAVDAFMVLSEIITMAYPGAPEEAFVLAELTRGTMAPWFWFQVIGGLVVPFLLLVFSRLREKTPVVVVASTLVVLGVFCKRIWLLLTSFIEFNVSGAPGLAFGRAERTATETWTLVGTYSPTWAELLITLGVLALAVLVYTLLAPRLFGTLPTHALHDDDSTERHARADVLLDGPQAAAGTQAEVG
jgi:molybdopterin-containing oxidoreductase family membrane subunit